LKIWVGIDVAKELHWVCAIDDTGEMLLSRKLHNEPGDIDRFLAELRTLGGERVIGVDVLGGIASLLCAALLESGEQVVHVPGLAVNRARQGTAGGETKSDPKDARVIADQIRTRRNLRPVLREPEQLAELRLLVSRRRDLVSEQTRRLSRLHELLVGVHPGLEQRLDLTRKSALHLLTRFVVPSEIRQAGRNRLLKHLQQGGVRDAEALAELALTAARGQHLALPAERVAADICRQLATEALQARALLAKVDAEIEEVLGRHPDAALVRSLPGMGAVLAGEFLVEVGNIQRFPSSDALAAAAGLAPVLRQSGKVRFLRRASGGNKVLKRVFYQSAFCSLRHPLSRAFYDRKRREGRRHHQAIIALARRRIDVIWAMLRDRALFRDRRAAA
jgi:transposase